MSVTEHKTQKVYHATKNTMLAAGLSAMGVPFFKDDPYSKVLRDKQELVLWRFDTVTANGAYKTKDLIDWWHDEDWFSENYPKHPWALVMSGILTKEYLVSKIKDEPRQVIVRKKSQTWLVFENSTLHKRLTNQL